MAHADVKVRIGVEDEASAKLKSIGNTMKDMSGTFKKVGLGMMAAGGLIAGGLGMATKAAEEERVGIARLSAQLKNVGVDYDSVADSLEGVISATQRKTGVADDVQREALGELILATGDYNTALGLLPLALDLAAAKQMDASAAGELLGKVAMGNTSMLARYGITLKEGATSAEALAAVQEKVAGTAEAVASPMTILKASLDDVSESIGGVLLPVVNTLLEKVVPLIDKIKAWIELHPELIKDIAGLAIALIGAGGLLFAFSQIAKMITLVNSALIIMKALSGPAGWAMLAAGLLIAAGAIAGVNKMLAGDNTTEMLAPPGPPTPPPPGVRYVPSALPMAFGGAGPGGDVYVTVEGSVIAEQELTDRLRESFLQIKGRNVTTGF